MDKLIEILVQVGDKVEPIGRASLAIIRLIAHVLEPRDKGDGTRETPEEVEARVLALVASAETSLGNVIDTAKSEIADAQAEIDKRRAAAGGGQ